MPKPCIFFCLFKMTYDLPLFFWNKTNNQTCCLFVQILAIVVMTEKPGKSHFPLKTHFVTHFNKKKVPHKQY